MGEPIHFLPTAEGFELRRGDVVAGRVGAVDPLRAQAEADGVRWELELHRDPERTDWTGWTDTTWQVVALDENGAQAAAYYHGGIRGGRVRLADGSSPALRRGIGLRTDWRLKSADCALTLRPGAGPDGTSLELVYVPGSVEQPDLVLLLICWCVIAEAQMPPTPLG